MARGRFPLECGRECCKSQAPEKHVLNGIRDGFPLCCIAQFVNDSFNRETHESARFRASGYSEKGKCRYVLCWDCQETLYGDRPMNMWNSSQ